MKGKAIAAALAALAVFGTAPVVSARHQAEEYAERVQREKKERWREAENEARLRAQAESRRRAAEERRIAEEQQRQNEMEILDDEDSEDDELIRGEVMELSCPDGGLMMIYGLYPGVPMKNAEALMDAMERYCVL